MQDSGESPFHRGWEIPKARAGSPRGHELWTDQGRGEAGVGLLMGIQMTGQGTVCDSRESPFHRGSGALRPGQGARGFMSSGGRRRESKAGSWEKPGEGWLEVFIWPSLKHLKLSMAGVRS